MQNIQTKPTKTSGSLARWLGLLALLLILIAGLFAADRFALALEDNQRNSKQQALRELASNNRTSVQSALRVLDESISGLGTYINSAASIDPNSFDEMAKRALSRNPALRAIGYAARLDVAPASSAAVAVPPTLMSSPNVYQRNWAGELVSASPRGQYFPIERLVSLGADEKDYAGLLRFDLLSFADLQAAIESKQQSVRYQSLVPGRAVVVLPNAANDQVKNVLFAELEVSKLLDVAGKTEGAAARVFDATDPSGLKLLFPRAIDAIEAPDSLAPALVRQQERSVQVNEFQALGRTFRVETTPLKGFFDQQDSRTPMLVRYAGFGLTALAALLLFNLITRNARIEKLVQIRGAELSTAYEQVRDSELMSMQAEKMSSLGQMVAGVAHEMNTPLAFVTSNVELLQERLGRVKDAVHDQDALLSELNHWQAKTGDEKNDWYRRAVDQSQVLGKIKDRTIGKTGELVDESIEGLARVRDLVSTLKDFSRVDRAPVDDINVHQCIENTLKVAHNVIKMKCDVLRDFGQLPLVRCNPSQINQVLLNLVTNAAQAMPTFGEIKILTRSAGDNIQIVVSDNGSGMPEAVMKRIFEPFFTTKASGEGTGLGLAICEKIIKAHGGTIAVESTQGVGTTFTIVLPVQGPLAS